MTIADFSQSTAGRVLIGFAIFAAGYYFPPWGAFTTDAPAAGGAASAATAASAASPPRPSR